MTPLLKRSAPPAAASPEPAPPPSPSPPPDIAPSPAPSPSPPTTESHTEIAAPRQPRVPRLRLLQATVNAVLAVGLLPGIAPGVAVHVAPWVSGRFRTSAGATFLPETLLTSGGYPFAFGVSALDLGACVDLVQSRRMVLSGCGAVWVGAIHAVVFALTPAQPGDRPWAGLSAEGRWTITLFEPLIVEFHAGALVPLTRYDFRVDGPIGGVFSQSVVTFVGGVGLGIHFR